MTATDEWYEEPSSWDYVVTPAFLISLTLSILLPKILSPLLSPIIVPKSKSILAKQQTHFHTLSSSTLHAVVVSVLCMYLLLSGVMEPNRVFSKHPVAFMTLQISYGYFIGDFIICLMDPYLRTDLGSILHHLAGICSITLGLIYQGQLMFYIVYRLVSELSTPIVNMRWFFYKLGDKNSFWYIFSSIGMMISFCLVRILPIPWHWYALSQTLQVPQCAVVVHFIWRLYIVGVYILFDGLNLYWFVKMILGALKFFSSSNKSH